MRRRYTYFVPMIPSHVEDPVVDSTALRDKALNLREAVNSSRARMNAQNDHMARLRAQIASLREMLEESILTVAAGVPAPATPVSKETAAESAPTAVSFQAGARPWRTLPYAAILAVALAIQLRAAPHRSEEIPSPSAAVPASAVSEDDGANEALLLVHEWRLPGDERALSDRLDPGVELPGAKPAWTVERTGELAYRVSFHAGEDAPSYDFDVDLDAHRVDPTPDTAELIAPRLVSR